MKLVKSSVRFWGRQVLQWIGIAALAALLGMVIQGFGMDTSKWIQADGFGYLASYPLYLLVVGGFTNMIFAISVFQSTFSVLLSMNVTRKAAAAGMVLAQAASVLGLVAVSAAVWNFVPGMDSKGFAALLPFFAGVLFGLAAFGLLMGVIYGRWGKIGIWIMVITFTAAGGVAGAAVAMTDGEVFMNLQHVLVEDLAGNNFWPLMAAGAGVYAAAGIFTMAVTGKIEVRV